MREAESQLEDIIIEFPERIEEALIEIGHAGSQKGAAVQVYISKYSDGLGIFPMMTIFSGIFSGTTSYETSRPFMSGNIMRFLDLRKINILGIINHGAAVKVADSPLPAIIPILPCEILGEKPLEYLDKGIQVFWPGEELGMNVLVFGPVSLCSGIIVAVIVRREVSSASFIIGKALYFLLGYYVSNLPCILF